MTTTLDRSRETLTWAANRLTEAHQNPDLPEKTFQEVLDTYILATRAYHLEIRRTNERIRLDLHRTAHRTNPAMHRVHESGKEAEPPSTHPQQGHG